MVVMPYCRRCRTEIAELHAYWGDPLCRRCARALASKFDELGKWPPVPWEPEEDLLLQHAEQLAAKFTNDGPDTTKEHRHDRTDG